MSWHHMCLWPDSCVMHAGMQGIHEQLSARQPYSCQPVSVKGTCDFSTVAQAVSVLSSTPMSAIKPMNITYSQRPTLHCMNNISAGFSAELYCTAEVPAAAVHARLSRKDHHTSPCTMEHVVYLAVHRTAPKLHSSKSQTVLLCTRRKGCSTTVELAPPKLAQCLPEHVPDAGPTYMRRSARAQDKEMIMVPSLKTGGTWASAIIAAIVQLKPYATVLKSGQAGCGSQPQEQGPQYSSLAPIWDQGLWSSHVGASLDAELSSSSAVFALFAGPHCRLRSASCGRQLLSS